MRPLFLQKVKDVSGIYLNTWSYNVCSIKLENESVGFAWNLVLEYFMVLANKYIVHNFWLWPVNILHTDCTCFIYISISLTCSLRCIVTTYCIQDIVNGYYLSYRLKQNKWLMGIYDNYNCMQKDKLGHVMEGPPKRLFSIFYMLNSRNRVWNPYFNRYMSNVKNLFLRIIRGLTNYLNHGKKILFFETLSDDFYGQSFIKTVWGPFPFKHIFHGCTCLQ